MKKIYKKTFILAILGLLMGSCEKYYDDYFEIKRPQEAQWTTTATFDQGLAQSYYLMQWVYGAGGRGYWQYLDYLTSGSAMRIPGTNPAFGGDLMLARIFTEQPSFNSSDWNDSYKIVTLSNLAIDLHNSSEDANPFALDVKGFDYQDNYMRQIGEYYFTRAWTYYQLVHTFGPRYDHNGNNDKPAIPLKSTAAYSKEDVMNEKIGTVEEVYQQIISDLESAKDILPDKINPNSWNNIPGYPCGRANKWVATALLGKIYFLMGKYTEAKSEFNNLITYAETTGTYQLELPKDPFNREKAADVPKESIWEFNSGWLEGKHNMYMYIGLGMALRFRDSNGDELLSSTQNKVGTVINPWVGSALGYSTLKSIGWMTDPENGDYSVTPEAETDLRFQQVYHLMQPYQEGIKKGDPEYLTTFSTSDFSMVTKPLVLVDKFFRGAAPYGKNSKFPYIRLADIYLLRAWLNWKDGNSQAAADDLNKVWNRSNPTNPNIYSVSNVSHEAIYKEYVREMTGEGWTVDFMMGTQMTIPVGDSEASASTPPPYTGWYWPIPDNELDLNPNYK